MEERLEKALNFSNFRSIFNTRQTNLKLLFDNKTTVSYEGGFFKITFELITFVDMLIKDEFKKFTFIDINDVPVLIINLPEFKDFLITQYQSASEQYTNSYSKLNEARNIRKVIDWDKDENDK